MRVVLCDDDALLQSMVETMVTRLGHEVVGVATTTAAGTELVARARPDAVIVDLAVGYNTDFDVVEAAIAAGATAVLFTHDADEARLSRYAVRPAVVPKPDLAELEQVVDGLTAGVAAGSRGTDRRRRPERAVSGPRPTGLADAEAFFEALDAASPGDALVSIDLPVDSTGSDAESVARIIAVRGSDRLLASRSTVRLFLPGAEADGVDSLLGRLEGGVPLPPGTQVTSVVVEAGEAPADAFDRLRSSGRQHDLAR